MINLEINKFRNHWSFYANFCAYSPLFFLIYSLLLEAAFCILLARCGYNVLVRNLLRHERIMNTINEYSSMPVMLDASGACSIS